MVTRIKASSMAQVERFLARSVGQRWIMGLVSLFYGILFGNAAWTVLLMPMPPASLWLTILTFVTQELLLAATAVALLVLIWAVATPRWVETLFRSAWKHLLATIVLALAPIIVLAILFVFGVTLAGVGP